MKFPTKKELAIDSMLYRVLQSKGTAVAIEIALRTKPSQSLLTHLTMLCIKEELWESAERISKGILGKKMDDFIVHYGIAEAKDDEDKEYTKVQMIALFVPISQEARNKFLPRTKREEIRERAIKNGDVLVAIQAAKALGKGLTIKDIKRLEKSLEE